MSTSTIQQQFPIKMAMATFGSNRYATVMLESGYTMSNTLILGVEFSNSSGTVINIQGTAAVSQCRWTSTRDGLYLLLGNDDFKNGKAVVYYMKVPEKYAFD